MLKQSMFSTSSEAILSSSFQYAGQHPLWGGFLWSRMRLFEDRIEFSGIGWGGRHQQTLPLARVKDLTWRTGQGVANFALRLHAEDGEAEDACIRMRVEAAGLWKHEVEARAPSLASPEHELPQSPASPAPARAA